MNWINALLLSLKLEKKVIYHFVIFPLVIVVFIIYWMITFFFTLPDNPISIKYTYGKLALNTLINQHWSIFSPTPKYSYKLYYVFESAKDSTHLFTYEAIQPIMNVKQVKAPFNHEEALVEDLIINSLRSIDHQFYILNESIDYINHTDSKKNYEEKIKLAPSRTFLPNSEINNLINYTKEIAKKNNFSLKNKYVRIKITKIFLNPFREKNQSEELKETLFYESKRIKF